MVVLEDDLGHPVSLERSPVRVVSLVPSLTEAIAATDSERLVGATDWCTHPEELDVTRVRGTKNPDHRVIAGLRPDLIIANQEENRRIDVERLRAAGFPVWVTVVESVDQALATMRRLLVDILGTDEPDWLTRSTTEWAQPPTLPPVPTLVPIWRDPWMVVGHRTFAGDIVSRLGLAHLDAGGLDRYPKIDLSALMDERPRLVLLPDEPYPFAHDDGPEAFPDVPTALVSGRDLTWYGPSMATARATLTDRIEVTLGLR